MTGLSPNPIALTPLAAIVHTAAMWRRRIQHEPGAPTGVADECEKLEHVIRTTRNTAVAELARLRLRAARFARDHATPTPAAAPPRATGVDALEDEIRRSSATVAHVTRSAELVDLTPRLPLLSEIAAENRARYDEQADRPVARTRVLPLLLTLPALVGLAAVAIAVGRDALQRNGDAFVSLMDWSKAESEIVLCVGGLAAASAYLAARLRWHRHHPRLLPPEDEP